MGLGKCRHVSGTQAVTAGLFPTYSCGRRSWFCYLSLGTHDPLPPRPSPSPPPHWGLPVPVLYIFLLFHYFWAFSVNNNNGSQYFPRAYYSPWTGLRILDAAIVNSSQHDVPGAILSPLYSDRFILQFTSRDLHSSEDTAENKTSICWWLDLFPWESWQRWPPGTINILVKILVITKHTLSSSPRNILFLSNIAGGWDVFNWRMSLLMGVLDPE